MAYVSTITPVDKLVEVRCLYIDDVPFQILMNEPLSILTELTVVVKPVPTESVMTQYRPGGAITVILLYVNADKSSPVELSYDPIWLTLVAENRVSELILVYRDFSKVIDDPLLLFGFINLI